MLTITCLVPGSKLQVGPVSRERPAVGLLLAYDLKRPSPLLPLQLEPTFVPTHHERSMNTRGQVSSHERRQRNVKVSITPL